MKLVRLALVPVVLVALVWPSTSSSAQEAPADPATTVLAIVSPIVAPACALSGTATLLVPIVSGLVSSSMPAGVPSVGDLLLDSLGPVFVVCGSLPSPPGTRCQVDDQIAGIVPIEVSSLTGPTPGIIGNLVDTLAALLNALGLPPTDALKDALVCSVNTGPGVVEAPGGDVPVEPPPTFEEPDLGTTFTPVESALPPLPAVTPAPSPTAPRAAPAQLVATVDRIVPGSLKALQLTAAGLLALTLLGGWVGSWREQRRQAPRP